MYKKSLEHTQKEFHEQYSKTADVHIQVHVYAKG